MEDLLQEYKSKLDQIKSEIQDSELLTNYLDEEGEEEYKLLIEAFENRIHEIYEEVALNHPLQIIPFENHLLDHDFEGLYLPKVLGYTVLRGSINENYTYERPQAQFKKYLEFITESSNFDQIKQRVGQSIQIGFALSSDIWITNIISASSNKQVKYFLQSQNLLKYHDVRNRRTAYVKYSKQFLSLNFYTANFPTNRQELITEFNLLKSFLLYRAEKHGGSNASLRPHLKDLIKNHEQFNDDNRFLELLIIIGMHYDPTDDEVTMLRNYFDRLRDKPEFEETFFKMMVRLHKEMAITPKSELRLTKLLITDKEDNIKELYKVLETIHSKGYMTEEAISASRDFYYSNEGLSFQNTCLRNSVFNYFKKLLTKLEPGDYSDYFEINKVMVQYINIFDNQQFNQDIKDTSLKYVKKLLKHFTDKRGRDYQDIKKFVTSTFLDLNFMSEKELKELFKTKRKPKPIT